VLSEIQLQDSHVPWIPRLLGPELARAAGAFPAVVLTGPRRAGKTFLLRHTFPQAQWVLLEDPDVLGRVRADPRGFLDGLTTPVILDEIQNAPELLPYLRTRIDGRPADRGQWFLTGSQDFALMRGVAESMAGRAAILRLLPLGTEETQAVSLLHGGYPEVVERPDVADLWFRSYVQTYLERDVRAIVNVSDVSLFRRFLAVLATRTGQLLNKTELAAPLGISVPTVRSWLDVLETTGVVLVVPPWHANFGKRLIKSPRVYFADSGLACHLLGIESEGALERSPLLGALFEGFVATELVKHRIHLGRSPGVYWFRDQAGLEVDFLLEGPGLEPVMIEAKATRTPTPGDAAAIGRLRRVAPRVGGPDLVVHRVSPGQPSGGALADGVRSVGVAAMHAELRARDL
jgi:uncharacterized protein